MKSVSRWVASAAILTLCSANRAGAEAVCGDVNNNGKVTSSDAQLVLREAVGQPVNLQCPVSGAAPLKTGDVTDYGTRSDGFLRTGVARSFTDNGDGTVTDNATGLMWEKKDNADGIHDKDTQYTWTTGSGDLNGTIITTFLAGLNAGSGFAGHKDWRIPTRFELETLLNMGTEDPATYPAFATLCPTDCTVTACSCTRGGAYWSSTTFFSEDVGAWAVYFNDADSAPILKVNDLYARAVRGGL